MASILLDIKDFQDIQACNAALVNQLRFALNDPCSALRQYAVSALAIIGHPRALKILKRTADTHWDLKVRRLALEALKKAD